MSEDEIGMIGAEVHGLTADKEHDDHEGRRITPQGWRDAGQRPASTAQSAVPPARVFRRVM